MKPCWSAATAPSLLLRDTSLAVVPSALVTVAEAGAILTLGGPRTEGVVVTEHVGASMTIGPNVVVTVWPSVSVTVPVAVNVPSVLYVVGFVQVATGAPVDVQMKATVTGWLVTVPGTYGAPPAVVPDAVIAGPGQSASTTVNSAGVPAGRVSTLPSKESAVIYADVLAGPTTTTCVLALRGTTRSDWQLPVSKSIVGQEKVSR